MRRRRSRESVHRAHLPAVLTARNGRRGYPRPRLDGTNICQLKKTMSFFSHPLLPYPGINFYEAGPFWTGQAPKPKISGSGVPGVWLGSKFGMSYRAHCGTL